MCCTSTFLVRADFVLCALTLCCSGVLWHRIRLRGGLDDRRKGAALSILVDGHAATTRLLRHLRVRRGHFRCPRLRGGRGICWRAHLRRFPHGLFSLLIVILTIVALAGHQPAVSLSGLRGVHFRHPLLPRWPHHRA